MKAFLESKASLSDTVKLEKAKNNNYLFSIENNSSKLTHAVGVFSHHRDVKVALEELRDTGFPLNWITLIARDCWRYSWSPGLSIYNYCDEGTLSFNQNSQHFFSAIASTREISYVNYRKGK